MECIARASEKKAMMIRADEVKNKCEKIEGEQECECELRDETNDELPSCQGAQQRE
jgi:hypothetical protein